MLNARITQTGLRYNAIYLAIFVLPFLFFLGRAGMTAIIFKTLGYITLPIPLLIWLLDLDLFHQYFSLLVMTNLILNSLILFWIGSFVERRGEDI